MIATIDKKSSSKSSTTAKQSLKHTNGAPAKKNGKCSGPPVATSPAVNSKLDEPAWFLDFDAIAAQRRAAEKNSKPVQDQLPVTARTPPPDVKQIEQLAIQLGQALGGKVAPPAQSTPAAAPSTPVPPAKPGTFFKECFPTPLLVAMLNRTLRLQVNPASVQIYLDAFVDEIGVANDPLNRVLAEQVAYMRIVAADLHNRTVLSTKSTEASAYNTAACAATAELRRTVGALKDRQKIKGSSRPKPDDKAVCPSNEAAASLEPKRETA